VNAWDDLAHDLDTGRIAHQLVLDCTQLSIPALRDDPIGAINRYVGINLVYADQDGSGCGSGYYRPDAALTDAAMRPSTTLNAVIEAL